MKENIFGWAVVILFSAGTVQQAMLRDWKLAGIYLCSAVLNVLFIV